VGKAGLSGHPVRSAGWYSTRLTSGAGVADLVAEADVSESTVRRDLKRHGLVVPPLATPTQKVGAIDTSASLPHRLCRWFAAKWFTWRETFVQVVLGALLIGLGLQWFSNRVENDRTRDSVRRENVQFVRSLSGSLGQSVKPFERFDLSNIDMNGLILPNSDLREATLSGSRLDGAVLDESWLSFADLHGAEMVGSGLRATHFLGADMRNTDLRFANLSRSDLSFANLSGSDLSKANLSFADLSRANLSGTTLSPDALTSDYLNGTYFFETDISGADLTQSKIDAAFISKLPVGAFCWNPSRRPSFPVAVSFPGGPCPKLFAPPRDEVRPGVGPGGLGSQRS
jgi:uncharacterized protein YjbI with pentapeptide repeats